ncbi:site-specific DNA-methyltransferase [Paenibacillus sp. FSL M7-1455]|uniref:DNA-methyltransferase n=1 Tax=Paenibacillus sp. FSL M7-1455 TaxID=2975316 RepID=UPI0030FA5953
MSEINVVLCGDSAEVLRQYPDAFFDSVVCDPPYGLSKEPDIAEVLTKWIAGEPYDHGHSGFMGKSWDSFVPHPDLWREVFRVLKPGGHALVFAGTRTQDLMTIALRLGGFEIRDVIEWLYFSGFPKSMDVGKAFDKREGVWRGRAGKVVSDNGSMTAPNYERTPKGEAVGELARKWDGWGTALKPAHEPIIVARKPLAGTVAETVEKYGTGAINIDGCRIGRAAGDRTEYGVSGDEGTPHANTYGKRERVAYVPDEAGRFPANCVTTDSDAFYSPYFNISPREVCKKASKADRNADWTGAEISLENRPAGGLKGRADGSLGKQTYNRNTHPTVKPIDLMAWLVRLVTPPGGIVLDPFAGSGSTLVAAKREGFGYVGIEREPEYVDIANARLTDAKEAA